MVVGRSKMIAIEPQFRAIPGPNTWPKCQIGNCTRARMNLASFIVARKICRDQNRYHRLAIEPNPVSLAYETRDNLGGIVGSPPFSVQSSAFRFHRSARKYTLSYERNSATAPWLRARAVFTRFPIACRFFAPVAVLVGGGC